MKRVCERKSERKREGEREREIGREKEGGRRREREIELLFLKGMTGALAPFSHLVLNNTADIASNELLINDFAYKMALLITVNRKHICNIAFINVKSKVFLIVSS